MVSAVVLLKAKRNSIASAAEKLSNIKGVSEVFHVGGRFDLVAVVRVKDHDKLATVVTMRINETEGITESETLIAFRTYSKFELSTMFDLY